PTHGRLGSRATWRSSWSTTCGLREMEGKETFRAPRAQCASTGHGCEWGTHERRPARLSLTGDVRVVQAFDIRKREALVLAVGAAPVGECGTGGRLERDVEADRVIEAMPFHEELTATLLLHLCLDDGLHRAGERR